MTDPRLKNDLELAVAVARKAAKLLNKYKKAGIVVNSSMGKDIKLQADIESEKIIVDELSKTGYNILSEESGMIRSTASQEYCWIVDPLDGSLNYQRGIDLYCISIGLWKDQTPIAGVIFDFFHDRMYTGLVGDGAYCNGELINVSDISQKSDGIIVTGFPVYSSFDTENLNAFVKKLQEYKKVRLLGSAATSLVHVAKGSAEVYNENNIAIWDVAAGLSIVMAAGGKIYFTEGKGAYYLNVYASNGR
jgi:myo-inositol-1(or 4)-monophosphatase